MVPPPPPLFLLHSSSPLPFFLLPSSSFWKTSNGEDASPVGRGCGNGGIAKDKECIPGPPGQGHEDQIPGADLPVLPVHLRNWKLLTFPWAHP